MGKDSREPLYPNPPAEDGEPEWISLRDAARLWADSMGEDVEEKFYALISAAWKGDFELQGEPQLFIFEVPRIYRGIRSNDLDDAELHGPISVWIGNRDIAMCDREDYYIIDQSTKTGISPFLAVKCSYTDDLTVYHAESHIDKFGELEVGSVDDQGNIVYLPVQYRDIVFITRKTMLVHLSTYSDTDSKYFDPFGNISEQEYNAMFSAISKRKISEYSALCRSNVLERLHIYKKNLSNWANTHEVLFPILQVPANGQSEKTAAGQPIRQDRRKCNASMSEIRQHVANYLRENLGALATQRGAIHYVQERLPNAGRDQIRPVYNKMASEDQQKPGPRPGRSRSRD